MSRTSSAASRKATSLYAGTGCHLFVEQLGSVGIGEAQLLAKLGKGLPCRQGQRIQPLRCQPAHQPK